MKKALFISVIIISSLHLCAQPGSLDNAFGDNGTVRMDFGSFNTNFYAMAVQFWDDKIIAVGQAAPNAVLVRLNSDGSPDNSFGNAGIVLSHFEPSETDGSFLVDVAIRPDGKIVALGRSGKDFTNFASIGIARFNEDGSMDDSFGQGGYVNTDFGALTEHPVALALQTDGKMVVLARTSTPNNKVLACFNEDGSPDANFGTDGIQNVSFGSANTIVTSLALQGDGKILVGGSAQRPSDPQINDFSIARFNLNGSLDMSFGTNGIVVSEVSPTKSSKANSIEVLQDGKILATGSEDIVVIKYNLNGDLDSSFGEDGIINFAIPNISAFGNGIAVQPDDKIVIGANTFSNSMRDMALVRFHSNGDIDQTFGVNGLVLTEEPFYGEFVLDVIIQSEGVQLLAGGHVPSKEFVLIRYLSGIDVGTIDFSAFSNQELVYPNPITESSTIKYTLYNTEAISIYLYSPDGKCIHSFFEKKERMMGEHVETFIWPSHIHSGNFVLTLSNGKGRVGIKVFKP